MWQDLCFHNQFVKKDIIFCGFQGFVINNKMNGIIDNKIRHHEMLEFIVKRCQLVLNTFLFGENLEINSFNKTKSVWTFAKFIVLFFSYEVQLWNIISFIWLPRLVSQYLIQSHQFSWIFFCFVFQQWNYECWSSNAECIV